MVNNDVTSIDLNSFKNEDPVEDDIQDESDAECDAEASTSRRFSEEVNALAHLSKDDLDSLTREVDELSDGSNSDSDAASKDAGDEDLGCGDDASLREQVLGLSSPESSSDESMSGDFPQGWKPKSRSSSSEHLHLLDIDDPHEAKRALFESARTSDDFLFEEESNSHTERSDDSDEASCDDELAAIVERGFLS